jgi:hypothetical protein
LRFFLNHRVIEESDVPAREGKTPHQTLTGVEPIHWLELLGFERYRQAA